MRKFVQGLLFGAVVGTVTALLNSPADAEGNKKIAKNYINNLTSNVKDIQASVGDLSAATHDLTGPGLTSLAEALKGIQSSVNRFQLEAQPRINRLNQSVDQLQKDIQASTLVITKNPLKENEN